MKDVLVLVASGFEDTELITTINILDREGVSFDLVSVEELNEVQGQRFAKISTKPLGIINTKDYKSLFLPGGSGYKLLLESNTVINIVKNFKESNKNIAAICAAPEVLKKANVLGDVKYTSFPGFAIGDNNTGNAVEVDKKIITGRDYLATPDTAFEFVKVIKR